jgi:hypothetical protein
LITLEGDARVRELAQMMSENRKQKLKSHAEEMPNGWKKV